MLRNVWGQSVSDLKVDIKNLSKFELKLVRSGIDLKRGVKAFLKAIGSYVTGIARTYSPESPIKRNTRKTNKSGKTNRRSSRVTSGSLRDSITFQTGRNFVSIFVPSNSRGGEYAEKIHDEKGQTWHKRGSRTVQKGNKADHKFIERAADDSEEKIEELAEHIIDAFVKGLI